MYVIGSQESCAPIATSMFVPSKQHMVNLCKQALGPDFFLVHSVSLQATHLVVFASLALAPQISNVKSQDVTLGYNNTLGNKGAVKIALSLGKTRIAFITAHLASGQDMVE